MASAVVDVIAVRPAVAVTSGVVMLVSTKRDGASDVLPARSSTLTCTL